MENITGNEPAMPIKGADKKFFNCNNDMEYTEWVKQCNPSIGLTIRQHFAAMAKIPWDAAINILNIQGYKDEEITINMVAELMAKYKLLEADALITELNKPTE